MNENDVKKLIRDAFEAMYQYAYMRDDLSGCGGEAYSAVENAAEAAMEALIPEMGVDTDPFAPTRTAQEWAQEISKVIKAAEADGMEIISGRTHISVLAPGLKYSEAVVAVDL